jgi:DNA topoisomerase-1
LWERFVTSCTLPSRYILVIAEKPKAASRIADALSDGSRARLCRRYGVPFWITFWHGKPYVIASAAGHLFGLTTDESGFPVFSYYWAPLWEIDESAKHTRKFFEIIAYLAKRAYMFVNACDYDIEGSVIGYSILKAIGGLQRAKRARYSALTRTDIRRAFRASRRLIGI